MIYIKECSANMFSLGIMVSGLTTGLYPFWVYFCACWNILFIQHVAVQFSMPWPKETVLSDICIFTPHPIEGRQILSAYNAYQIPQIDKNTFLIIIFKGNLGIRGTQAEIRLLKLKTRDFLMKLNKFWSFMLSYCLTVVTSPANLSDLTQTFSCSHHSVMPNM